MEKAYNLKELTQIANKITKIKSNEMKEKIRNTLSKDKVIASLNEYGINEEQIINIIRIIKKGIDIKVVVENFLLHDKKGQPISLEKGTKPTEMQKEIDNKRRKQAIKIFLKNQGIPLSSDQNEELLLQEAVKIHQEEIEGEKIFDTTTGTRRIRKLMKAGFTGEQAQLLVDYGYCLSVKPAIIAVFLTIISLLGSNNIQAQEQAYKQNQVQNEYNETTIVKPENMYHLRRKINYLELKYPIDFMFFETGDNDKLTGEFSDSLKAAEREELINSVGTYIQIGFIYNDAAYGGGTTYVIKVYENGIELSKEFRNQIKDPQTKEIRENREDLTVKFVQKKFGKEKIQIEEPVEAEENIDKNRESLPPRTIGLIIFITILLLGTGGLAYKKIQDKKKLIKKIAKKFYNDIQQLKKDQIDANNILTKIPEFLEYLPKESESTTIDDSFFSGRAASSLEDIEQEIRELGSTILGSIVPRITPNEITNREIYTDVKAPYKEEFNKIDPIGKLIEHIEELLSIKNNIPRKEDVNKMTIELTHIHETNTDRFISEEGNCKDQDVITTRSQLLQEKIENLLSYIRENRENIEGNTAEYTENLPAITQAESELKDAIKALENIKKWIENYEKTYQDYTKAEGFYDTNDRIIQNYKKEFPQLTTIKNSLERSEETAKDNKEKAIGKHSADQKNRPAINNLIVQAKNGQEIVTQAYNSFERAYNNFLTNEKNNKENSTYISNRKAMHDRRYANLPSLDASESKIADANQQISTEKKQYNTKNLKTEGNHYILYKHSQAIISEQIKLLQKFGQYKEAYDSYQRNKNRIQDNNTTIQTKADSINESYTNYDLPAENNPNRFTLKENTDTTIKNQTTEIRELNTKIRNLSNLKQTLNRAERDYDNKRREGYLNEESSISIESITHLDYNVAYSRLTDKIEEFEEATNDLDNQLEMMNNEISDLERERKKLINQHNKIVDLDLMSEYGRYIEHGLSGTNFEIDKKLLSSGISALQSKISGLQIILSTRKVEEQVRKKQEQRIAEEQRRADEAKRKKTMTTKKEKTTKPKGNPGAR